MSPAGMLLTKVSLAGKNNYSRPGRAWLVTSRLGTGKTITFFTVYRHVIYLVSKNELAQQASITVKAKLKLALFFKACMFRYTYDVCKTVGVPKK